MSKSITSVKSVIPESVTGNGSNSWATEDEMYEAMAREHEAAQFARYDLEDAVLHHFM